MTLSCVTDSYTLYDICVQYYEFLKCFNFALEFNVRPNQHNPVKIEKTQPNQTLTNLTQPVDKSGVFVSVCVWYWESLVLHVRDER